jgi:uncharacterized protein
MKSQYKLKQIGWAVQLCLLLCCIIAASSAAAGQSPKYKLPAANPTSPVSDLANVIDPQTEQQLDRILKNFESLTGTQIAVATIPSLQERPLEDYANELYRAWGIGAKNGNNKDKGALLLVAPNDRKSRLEVGYGLEGDLPDGLAGEQLRRMRPYFQQGQYSQGLNVGVRTLVDTLAEKWNVNVEGIDRQYAYHPPQQTDATPPAGAFICLVIALLLFLILLYFASRRKGGGGGGSSYRRDAAWQAAPFIFNSGGGDYGSGSWGSSGGGGSSSDSGGSDWGGFGGGSSGGGGASDSW